MDKKFTAAALRWSDSKAPQSVLFDDFYFSSEDGVAETSYIYLDGNHLTERFKAARHFCIAETGFGTGLNFLTTLHLWLKSAPETAQLHFISVEKHPLDLASLAQTHALFPELAREAAALREAYPLLLPGWHECYLFDGRVRLTLWFGEAVMGLSVMEGQVDAWFLDGFAPAKNPEMWTKPLFQQMARLSHLETTYATFTAARVVRDGLASVGFSVEKRVGFGCKREMCFGKLVQVRPFSSKTPWFRRPPVPKRGQSAVVVGAGLAGATVAYALAEAGLEVTVLEANEGVAQEASSNLAGAIHPLVTADWNLRSQFYLNGLEATLRWLQPWLAEGLVEGELNGLLQLSVTEALAERGHKALQRIGLPDTFMRAVSAMEASDLLGSKTDFSGFYFPQGGWVRPASVVQQCLTHPRIRLQTGQKVKHFVAERDDVENYQAWLMVTEQGQTWRSEVVVFASGALDEALNQQLGLPLRPVKGQTTFFPQTNEVWRLRTTVTHEGYTANCPGGILTGATFEAPDMARAPSFEAHQKNLAQLQQVLPDWPLSLEAVSANVAFRPTVPDHLPIIGALADPDWMQQAYLSQSHTHVPYRYAAQRYLPGLYVSNGHGARGLMSVFLAAEVIRQQITGEMPRLPSDLLHAVHPAKYLIRQWRSGQNK